MSNESLANKLQELLPQVTAFRTDEFELVNDLRKLLSVKRVDAGEAVLFYCARIVEALTGTALKQLGIPGSHSVYTNLVTLEECGLLRDSTRYWAHGLRRLGNDVRHLLRLISAIDADLGLLYVERWLEWYFCRFPLGPRLSQIGQNGAHVGFGDNPSWYRLVDRIERAVEPDEMAHIAEDPVIREMGKVTSLVSSVIVEALLDRGRTGHAADLAAWALTYFPGDLRLQQLFGTAESRLGHLDSGRACLEECQRIAPDDEETTGILGGIYKRLAEQDPLSNHWLNLANQKYRQGWKRSGRKNTYLGINAATTSLFLGASEQAASLAEDVKQLQLLRQSAIAKSHCLTLEMDFWGGATLAEAELILGNWPAALDAYRQTIAAHPHLHGAIEVAYRQAARIIDRNGNHESREVLSAFEPRHNATMQEAPP